MRLFKISATVFAALLIVAAAAAAADTPQLSARLTAPMDAVRSYEPLAIEYTLENVSDKSIVVPAGLFSANTPGETGMFFYITGPDGMSLNNNCAAAGAASQGGTINMMPGEYHGRKNIRLNECYDMKKAGKYAVRAIFTSSDDKGAAWSGTLKSPTITIDILESAERTSMGEASIVIADWQQNYRVASGLAYKRKLISIGLPSAKSVAKILASTTDYSFASDLISVLSALPCRESGDALVEFLEQAPNRKFVSNMPAGFNPGTVLIGETMQALEDMTRADLKLYKRVNRGMETGELWKLWWTKNRETFPVAVPEE